MTLASKKQIEGYAFMGPGFLYVLIMMVYPLVYNIRLAFQNLTVKNFTTGADFVGLENFKTLFADETFLLIFKNTVVYTVGCIIFQFSIGFLFALLFSKKFTLCGPIRGLILVAYMLPMSVTGLLGKNLFLNDGVINRMLQAVGLQTAQDPIQWLTSSKYAMIAVIIVNCWVGIPFNMLLLTAGLTGIDDAVMEAASIDGANAIQRFFRITVPLLKPAIMSVLMLGLIYTFKAFDLMFIMTAGGPNHATDVLGTYAYQYSFQDYQFSLGSAVALVLFGCLLIVGVFYMRMIMKEDD